MYVDPEYLAADCDIDDDAPPASAEDYLRRVAREAKALPDVVCAPPPSTTVSAAAKAPQSSIPEKDFNPDISLADSQGRYPKSIIAMEIPIEMNIHFYGHLQNVGAHLLILLGFHEDHVIY